ncbi:MAG: D-glycero-beta-D-manno-heptose-7-phosphate kinase, partial [Betaproteobacteria bacterium]|nr:D-glycero-beta-D-manno-heptose-7-phosphate kinase [Betaproteobacteria bacterium]
MSAKRPSSVPARTPSRRGAVPSSKFDRSVLSRARVLVVGDVMLDRYWFGEVGRISPEAPVPVVKIDRIEERPGGAANVARN